jgi:hypothetical protein
MNIEEAVEGVVRICKIHMSPAPAGGPR